MTKKSLYIVGPLYDWCFFLLAPLYAVLFGVWISGSWFTEQLWIVSGSYKTAAKVFLGTLIHAHLVAVFFRSHNNTKIFRLYPYRFLLVPVVLWLSIYSTMWCAITATVVATFWDVWHSGAQTFGFASIYERNNNEARGQSLNPQRQATLRRLDYWLNQLLYAGPILAGVTLLDHLMILEGYEDVGAMFFAEVPALVDGYQRWLLWAVVFVGVAFFGYYLFFHWMLCREGYEVSRLKVFLLVVTGFCSIYSWGFNTWGEAFFMMNFFHAIQYLALVWGAEKKNIAARLRLSGGALATALVFSVFLGMALVYGLFAELTKADARAFWSVTLVVSLMHFWYDGFVWSVSRRQV